MENNSNMDTAKIKELLGQLESGKQNKNEEYNNNSEHLKSIMDWVHTAKEAGYTEQAMNLIIDARGLDIIVACIKRNLGDTVVAARALEILAGEMYSNGSLPFLDTPRAVAKMIELGLVEVLLSVLRLPDLNAIGRGLACRALRVLITGNSAGVASLVKKASPGDPNGVDELLAQIYHVDRGWAFAALSVLTRSSDAAREQVRSFPKALPLLLTRFAEKPFDYAPDDDPAASMLFLSTWSWAELKKELEDMGEKGYDAYDVLEGSSLRKYGRINLLSDTLSPLVDYSTEMANTYFYITTGKWGFLALASGGILYNTVMSTNVLSNKSCSVKFLNVLTFGYFNIISESQACYSTGLKSDAMYGLKMFKGINSMIRFFVGTYSLLVAGYLPGFASLHGLQLATRWASVFSSLFFIPWACCDIVMARTQPGKREFGQSFLMWTKTPGFYAALVLYQGSEVWSQVTLLIFQVLTQPVGIYVDWFCHISCLALAVMIMDRCQMSRYTWVPMPMAVLWTINGGATAELQCMSRAGGLLRILNLTACWVWIYLRLGHNGGEFLDHLISSKQGAGLCAIALLGSILHVVMFIVMRCMGRWRFENMDGSSRGDYEAMGDVEMQKTALMGVAGEASEATRARAGGLYDTASEAPLVVADRWAQVHELLPNATARVTRPAFVEVHKKMARISAPGRNSADGSPYADFLDALFTAATGLMYPKKKNDLGKHCYGYSSLISDEYYEDDAAPPDSLGLLKAPAIGWFDPLKVIRTHLRDDWELVQKDTDQRVDLASYKKALLHRHGKNLGGITEATTAFTSFIEKNFEACRRISGRSDQQWLDQHSFSYGALMAYEFYYADARDAERAEGCGCSTPVADNLGITVPLPKKRAKSTR